MRIMPHRVPPSARAASFSLGGVWAKTSREIEATMGSVMRATTMPAMKIDPVRCAPGSVAKNGIQAKVDVSHSEIGSTCSVR